MPWYNLWTEELGEAAAKAELFPTAVAELEATRDRANRLTLELVALAARKEADEEAFDAERAKMTKELQDLKRKVEEILATNALVKDENSKLRSETLTAKQKYSMSEAEVKRLRMELSASLEAKEAAAKAFDAEKYEIIKNFENLKRKVEEIQTSMEEAEEARLNKDTEASKLKAELAELHVSMSRLQASYDELDAKCSRLSGENNSIQEALDAEKAEACKLESKVKALENYNAEKDGEVKKLKAELEEKTENIDILNKDIELLQLTMAEMQRKKKGGICPTLSSVKAYLSSCNPK
ncbi:hypothetical protein BS78_05G128800 [Paspalum vaginatum]|nr:hypothetical protein BS78_05G128800 [Paspalum vaginatum]